MDKSYLSDEKPSDFPFIAWLAGVPVDYRRTDILVEVLGLAGMQRSYYRAKLPCGRVTVANDSMIYRKRENDYIGE